ncbi:MAG: ImmA/IrrE family metallo-endopeptidase [Gammaproteobacteria bacterium]|nr:ImmA/IrrE family metallo-endopeptidase [Gammaproteobacteria bacterium]
MRVSIQPELLHWALERAGLNAEALEKKFPKLPDWLDGELAPTLRQLEAFASTTHTAIGYLMLPEPPVETLPIPDFRTMAHTWMDHPSPDLLDMIYLCQQRQDWYRDYARLHGDEPLVFVGTAQSGDDVVEMAADISQVIGFDWQRRQQCSSWSEALRQFIRHVDDAGILVMVSGIVASNTHRKLDPEEFRGFTLVDDLAPLIFINGSDTKAAQMFTLAHELAHIWLGASGVIDTKAMDLPDEDTEYWCNAVAAELLAPLQTVRQHYAPDAELHHNLQRLARLFKVSTLVVLRRIFDLGEIDKQIFWDTYHQELDRLRNMERKGSGGGDFYNTLGARTGQRLIRALVASTLEGQTLFQDAFHMLGIRKTATFYKEAKRLGLH